MKFRARVTWSFLFLISSFFCGCNTMSDVLTARDNGEAVSEIYSVSENVAWEVAKKVVRQEGFGLIEEVRPEGYFLTSSDIGAFEHGALVGVWIEPVGKTKTKVSIISKRKVATNIFTKLTEEEFHEEFLREVTFK